MDNAEFKVVVNGVAVFYTDRAKAVKMAKFVGYPLNKIEIGAQHAYGESVQSSNPGNATGGISSGQSGYLF